MSDIQWVKGCPEQKARYIIPTARYGDVIVMRVPTPDIFAESVNRMPYEEGDPVYYDGDRWHCLDWNGDRNEFVLALANQAFMDDKLDSPQAQRDILAIVYGEMDEVFQMVLL